MGAHEAGPRFRILGPLLVTDAGGAAVPLGGRRPRELLALLLLHPGQVLPTSRLVAALWGEDAGDGAATTLRTHVATVRRALTAAGAGDALDTAPGGYALGVEPDDLDTERFEQQVHQGQDALALGDPERALPLLDGALALWRGDPLADLGPPDFAVAAIARLDELRLVAEETAATAALALGQHRELVGRLQGLVAAHPFRERFCGQLMLALYRSGRQADALAAYGGTRRRLADELGLDPGPELQELETAMLRQEPTLLLAADPDDGPRPTPAGAGRASRTPRPPDAVYSALRRSPLVGRDGELRLVLDTWRGCRDGDRGLLLLSGAAGSGKSRLAAELAHLAAGDGAEVLLGRCDDGAPYAAVTSALAGSPRAQQLAAAAPDGMRAGLRPVLPTLPTTPGAGTSGKAALLAAVHGLVAALAAEAPVLWLVEDAERLDGAGAALLRSLVTRMPARALVTICFRDPPGSRHPPLAELLAHPGVPETAQRVTLGPLGQDALRALVESVHPGAPEPFVAALREQTGGNPFFAHEVLRDLDPAELRAGRPVLRVPAGVRDVLRQRLHGLPGTTRQALAAAAVLGREVELARLSRVLEEPEDRVVDALEVALGAGLLVEGGSSWAGGYAFPHELVREAVHADIPAPRRQRLHGRALAVLTEGHLADADLVAAAGHARAAGPAADPVEAAELVDRAARLAAATFGYEEAVQLAESRLPLLARYAAPAERADAAVDVARLRVRAGRGYARAVTLLEEALSTYLAVGDTEAAGRVHSRLGGALSMPHGEMDLARSLEHFAAAERLLARPESASSLHRGRMGAAMLALDLTTLGAASEKCAALAEGAGRSDLAAAGWGRGWHALDLGRPDDALARLEEAWSAVQDLGDPAPGWPVANAAALICTVFLRDPSAGRAWCRRALGRPRFEALEHPHHALADQLVLALAETGELEAARRAADALPPDAVGRRLVRFLLGSWEAAAAEWRAALARDVAAGDRHDAVLNSRWLGEALLALGDVPGAVEVLTSALDLAVAAPQVPSELWLRARLARLTRDAEAKEHLARCEELLEPGLDWRGLAGEVALARAAVAATTGDLASAGRAAADAAATFAAYRLPWRRVEALREGARLLAAAGRPAEAAERAGQADAVLAAVGAPARWRELNATSTALHEG